MGTMELEPNRIAASEETVSSCTRTDVFFLLSAVFESAHRRLRTAGMPETAYLSPSTCLRQSPTRYGLQESCDFAANLTRNKRSMATQ